jgi:D-aminoacyl-tRNA deacylase
MKLVIQRGRDASVTIDGKCTGQISQGLVILVGVGEGDSDDDALLLAGKCVNLRIFEDDEGKMNKSLLDIGGEALSISQFTLHADCRKGRRPSFIKAAKPDEANRLYKAFNESLRNLGVTVATGEFGAMMDVKLVNTGPVTIILDTDELRRPRRQS